MNASTGTRLHFSVVIATYAGETAAHLEEALLSLVHQTVMPSEMLIVLDGPVPEEQLTVIEKIRALSPFPIETLPLPENVGRGLARNIGISKAREDLIALMDSDDVCTPSRFEVQLNYLSAHPQVDVLAGWTEEFIESTPASLQKRQIKYCPLEHASIAKALKWTNCVANPSLLIRKSAWEAVGGFPDYKDINEDYLFYFRLLRNKARFACVPEIVLNVRISPEQRRRRRGLRLLQSDFSFRVTALKEGHISVWVTIASLALISVRRLAPPFMADFLQNTWRRLAKRLHT